MSIIQIILLGVFLFAGLATWRQYRFRRSRFIEFFVWEALWVAGALIVSRPEITSRLAIIFGIGRGADLIVYCAVILLFWLVFRIFLRLDRFDRELTKIVSAGALDEFERQRKIKTAEKI